MKKQRVSARSSQSCLVFMAVLALVGVGCGGATTGTTRQGNGITNAGTSAAGAAAGSGAGSGGSIGVGKADSGATGTSGTGAAGSVAAPADSGIARVFDAGSESGRNDVVVGKICERMSTIQCAGEAFCCTNPGRTEAECKATMLQGCTTQLMIDDIAANPITGFDAIFATAAFTHYEDITSKCDPGVAAWGESVDGLRGILRGTRNAGQSCTPATTSLSNKVPAAAALASCNDLATQACLPRNITLWSCAPKNGVGGNCFSDVNCTAGLYCDNPKFKLTGTTCKTRKADGTACVNPNECASLFCKKSVCAPTSQQAAFCLQN